MKCKYFVSMYTQNRQKWWQQSIDFKGISLIDHSHVHFYIPSPLSPSSPKSTTSSKSSSRNSISSSGFSEVSCWSIKLKYIIQVLKYRTTDHQPENSPNPDFTTSMILGHVVDRNVSLLPSLSHTPWTEKQNGGKEAFENKFVGWSKARQGRKPSRLSM